VRKAIRAVRPGLAGWLAPGRDRAAGGAAARAAESRDGAARRAGGMDDSHHGTERWRLRGRGLRDARAAPARLGRARAAAIAERAASPAAEHAGPAPEPGAAGGRRADRNRPDAS